MAGNPARSAPYGERNEAPAERLDRNWNELLQEMRVIQTGIQILFGFLLTVPFQPRFVEMGRGQQRLYLVVVGLVALATVVNLAPILAHRVLFRRGEKDDLVDVGNWFAVASMLTLGCALIGGALLVVSLVTPWTTALAVIGIGATLMAALWIGLPIWIKRRP